MDMAAFDSWLQTSDHAGRNSNFARPNCTHLLTIRGRLTLVSKRSRRGLSRRLLSTSACRFCATLACLVRRSFSSFLLSNSAALRGDPVVGLLENVFLYVYEGSQHEGAELIQRLSLSGPSGGLLAMRIIDEMVPSNVVCLVPLAVAPLDGDAAEQIDTATSERLLDLLGSVQHQG
jgi:hypothetical protein